MANYQCTVRTNYFHVEDPDEFRALMSRARGNEGSIDLLESFDSDGYHMFAFGAEGGIAGIEASGGEVSYEAFLNELQQCVRENDAIIIFEVGHEKLRYIVGAATVITRHDYNGLDLTNESIKLAKELLSNPEWTTKTEY